MTKDAARICLPGATPGNTRHVCAFFNGAREV